jgi:methionine synthase II (cobalamin-independent)
MCPEVPAWPQLPNRSFLENTYVQFAYDLPGIVIDSEKESTIVDAMNMDPEKVEDFLQKVAEEDVDTFKFPEQCFAGFYEMLEQAGSAPSLRLLKGQMLGPVSFGLKLTDASRQSVIYDQTMADILTSHLRMKARWQQKALSEVFPETLVMIDEPYLNMFGSAFLSMGEDEVLEFIEGVIKGLPGKVGIHCCGNTDWRLVFETGLDVLSLDAYVAGDVLALYSDDVQAFLDRKGIIEWGIVPSIAEDYTNETRESLLEKLEKAMGLLTKKGIELDAMLEQSMISPSCGLGGMSETMAEDALEVTQWISDSLRKKHNLEV